MTLNTTYNEKLPTYQTNDGTTFDLLDLKVALLYHGIRVDDEVYQAFEGKARLSRSPFSCNAMILDNRLFCSLSRTEQETPFRLTLNAEVPVITYNNEHLINVSFPEKTSFYDQKTTGGIPFGNLGVIQGYDMLSFACLWRCEITTSGNACGFCHTGNFESPKHSLSEMMDVIRYAVDESPKTKMLQLTAGSTFNPEKEIDRYVEILESIDKSIGIEKVPTTIYLTPPKDLKQLDRLFDAGVAQIACDMDIWDERLFEKICPGKAEYNTRQRYLDALLYIAEKYGKNRACCVFVGGIETVESLVEGATFLAGQGIVPLPSPLMPFGVDQKVIAEMQPFSLDYYRKLRYEIAKLYQKHDLIAPGTYGSDVCISRDVWLRKEILSAE